MESDSVRTMGDSTLVDLWIEGKFRAITISRPAIEAYLQVGVNETDMSETDRREFVRTHLGLVVTAATEFLRVNPGAETIEIDQLGSAPSAPRARTDRRTSGDRRKGERRKQNLGPPGGVERRR